HHRGGAGWRQSRRRGRHDLRRLPGSAPHGASAERHDHRRDQSVLAAYRGRQRAASQCRAGSVRAGQEQDVRRASMWEEKGKEEIMRRTGYCLFALAAVTLATPGAVRAEGPTGLNVPIGDPSRADQEYVWISNASNLPLFVERVYPGLESARKALNVKVRIAGPTSVDLAAFIATVDAECTQNPAGASIVGGWEERLAHRLAE